MPTWRGNRLNPLGVTFRDPRLRGNDGIVSAADTVALQRSPPARDAGDIQVFLNISGMASAAR